MLGEGTEPLIRIVWVGFTDLDLFVCLFLTLDFNFIIPFNVMLYTEPCLSPLNYVITNSINFLRNIIVLSFSFDYFLSCSVSSL